MNNFLQGFLKEAISLKALAKPKNLMRAAGVGFIAVPTALAAKAGYARGRSGDEKERYLGASFDELSGHAMPTRTSRLAYGRLFHKPTEKEKKKPSKHYDEKDFK
jgi:hypothetical protein